MRFETDGGRVILIGGSSHVGKSTLARALAAELGCGCLSTDKLARHPGRPWSSGGWVPPPHVAPYYLALSADELMEDVLRHYRSLRPRILEAISARARGGTLGPLVMEGSALLPEIASSPMPGRVSAVWLTAGGDFLRRRILAAGGFDTAASGTRAAVLKFAERAAAFDALVRDEVSRLGLPSIDVRSVSTAEELLGRCLEILNLR